jgi:hypothetical protein
VPGSNFFVTISPYPADNPFFFVWYISGAYFTIERGLAAPERVGTIFELTAGHCSLSLQSEFQKEKNRP